MTYAERGYICQLPPITLSHSVAITVRGRPNGLRTWKLLKEGGFCVTTAVSRIRYSKVKVGGILSNRGTTGGRSYRR